MTSTFWGLRLEPGKRYSTTVDKSFHVTMAALDCSTIKNDKDIHCVMLEEGESNIPFILCNLQKPQLLQSRLDLNFESGDRITFFCRGTGTVHLTGYIIPEDDDFTQFGEDEEVEEEEEEVDDEIDDDDDEKEGTDKVSKFNGIPVKRKGGATAGLVSKKLKTDLAEQESGDDSDDDNEDVEGESADSDELPDSEEESSEIEEEKPSPVVPKESKKKQKNKAGQSPGQQQGKQKQQQNPALNGPQQSSPGQAKKKQPQQQGGEKPAGKKHLEGGVAVQDLKVGNGPICKPGKMATVYYTGRLKSNNKVFDQTTQGAGFKFRVGRGEVIKGWDVGLSGMKVGGKRQITCPPNMAYGQKGMPPTIPGNSALVFEVELKGVN